MNMRQKEFSFIPLTFISFKPDTIRCCNVAVDSHKPVNTECKAKINNISGGKHGNKSGRIKSVRAD